MFFDKFCIFACLNNVDMKKVSILLSMLFVLSLCSFGQDATTNGPEITFKETLHDFGKITFNGNGTCEFVFVIYSLRGFVKNGSMYSILHKMSIGCRYSS